MARLAKVHVSALCVLSFVYIANSFERHSLTERPRLSSLLVFLLSGCFCYAASLISKWLPGADGRFTNSSRQNRDGLLLGTASDDASPKGSSAHMPNRPRRWSLPVLILLIVARLEVFHQVNHQQQCSTPGIESFLCLLLLGYEIVVTHRRWGSPAPAPDDDDDPWHSVFDDLWEWFSGPRVVMVNTLVSAFIFSFGTFLSVSQTKRSTYFCFDLIDSRFRIVSLQLVGLVLDATILVLIWRMLAWARTTKLRIQLLGTVLLLSSLSILMLWVSNSVFRGTRRVNVSFGSLYWFDVVVDSIAFVSLLISAMVWICETSPITPVSTLTFLIGIWNSSDNVFHLGDWLHISRGNALGPLWIIVFGTILFTYLHDLRSVLFIRRVFLATLLLALLWVATIFTFVKKPETFSEIHPVNNLVYAAQIEHDRWLSLVSTSTTLSTAVKVYQEHHGGMSPPPNFGDWYKYAEESPIIDGFDQIDRDLMPFWGIPPQMLRLRADEMAAVPGVATITIKDGQATWKDTGSSGNNQDLEEVVNLIKKFSKHLPDMILPINLSPTPRVLPTWEEANSKHRTTRLGSLADLLSRRSTDEMSNATESINAREGVTTRPSMAAWNITWASDFRKMQIEACSPLSRSRARPHWNFRQFCWACAKAHSQGQLLAKWQQSLEVCAQPDLRLLHGFSLTDPRQPPIRQLMPLFGGSKTDEFRDIIIPLPKSRLEKPDIDWDFKRRHDALFWRGSVGEHAINNQALRGSHKYRLLHLANTPYPQDEVTMVLPVKGDDKRFGYERASAAEANGVVPFNVGVGNYSACLGNNCDLVEKAYGTRDESELLEHRYVLLLDEDDGPPLHMMRTLRSNSVPFVSTIFRTWFTERLMPWLHFVPIDPRYQALHTTFAYFSGTEKRPQINGRETSMSGRIGDAEWIVQQGQRWAQKALGKKDMEIYLFRLLLEWGRLIDDHRDVIGFRKGENGEFQNVGWTRQQ